MPFYTFSCIRSCRCHDGSVLFIMAEFGWCSSLEYFVGELQFAKTCTHRKVVCRWHSVNERKRKYKIYRFEERKNRAGKGIGGEIEASKIKKNSHGRKGNVHRTWRLILCFFILNKHIHAWIHHRLAILLD